MSTLAQKVDLVGFGIEPDVAAKELRPGLWFGGRPPRVLRLSPTAAAALTGLLAGGRIINTTDAIVARRLVDAGLAHPVPPITTSEPTPDVTVIVPVHGRAAPLARCLASLGRRHDVIVVDDGSPDPAVIRAIAAEHGARLIRLDVNAGPAAARNAGLAASRTELVAFVDSDTEPGTDWIEALAPHFADPHVAAVAPRIAPRAADTVAGRYTRARGSLDLGGARGLVVPYTAVSYVPTAALLARRAALSAVGGFDPSLRVGEDVDLVWRLVAAGGAVRYEPAVRVPHDEPTGWRELLHRRYRYGTSAAPLARRHPRNVAPLVVHPWYSTAVAALLAGHPVLAVGAAAGAGWRTRAALRRADVPTDGLARATVGALGQAFLGTARFATQFATPLLLAGLTHRPTRLPAAALLLTPALVALRSTRPQLDPVRFTVTAIADDVAYGAGVIAGCIRHRTTVPLRPVRAR